MQAKENTIIWWRGKEGEDSNKNVSVMNRRRLIRSTKTDVGSLGQKSI